MINEALDCLGSLDSYLQFEEWEMERIEAQEEADDDDIEEDQWNFGIAPMLWQIQL